VDHEGKTRMQTSDENRDNAVNGKAWADFCDSLKEAGQIILDNSTDDIDRLEERMPETVYDFPFGAPRFIQRAVGYHATLCNGTVVLRDDEFTGEYGGRVLRK